MDEHVEACIHCSNSEEPTFREEIRVSYMEIGEKPTIPQGPFYLAPGQAPPSQKAYYARRRSIYQRVLVCLNCGGIHEIIEMAKA